MSPRVDVPRTLLFVVNDLGYFISHRISIARAAQAEGFDVHVAYGASDFAANPSDDNFAYHQVNISRGGVNPVVEMAAVISLRRLFLRVQPQIVHLVTLKPVVYGGIAARLAGVPCVVSAVAGLGFLAGEKDGLPSALLKKIIQVLLTFSLAHKNQSIIVQNPDDKAQLTRLAGVDGRKISLIKGSGVDVHQFPIVPEMCGIPVIAMASRLVRDKGIFEYIEAAKILRDRGIEARFQLIGKPDPGNPNSVTESELAQIRSTDIVEVLGHRTDVPAIYSQAHIVVLPSYYGEGLPKTLIEAAACGRPVVTTDMPGCRDAVVRNETGLLIPPKNAVALAGAIEYLLSNPDIRKKMGLAARQLALREFGLNRVVLAHLNIYKKLCSL